MMLTILKQLPVFPESRHVLHRRFAPGRRRKRFVLLCCVGSSSVMWVCCVRLRFKVIKSESHLSQTLSASLEGSPDPAPLQCHTGSVVGKQSCAARHRRCSFLCLLLTRPSAPRLASFPAACQPSLLVCVILFFIFFNFDTLVLGLKCELRPAEC